MLVLVDEEEEYEVKGILRHKRGGAWSHYLMLWKDYPLAEVTYEPESHLTNAPLILEDCLHCVVTIAKPRQNREEMSI